MWIKYNNNPVGANTEDCVIRAVAIALNITWDDAFDLIAQMAKGMGQLMNQNAVWGAVLRQHGFTRHIIPNTCPNCYSVEDFAMEHPEGIYVLGTGTHAIAIIDGNYYDTWDSGREIPIYFWAY